MSDDKPKGPSAAAQMARAASAGVLARDRHGEAWWAPAGGYEAERIDGRAFRDRLALGYHRDSGKVPARSAVADAAGIVAAKARREAPGDIFNRAGGDFERVYIALYDADASVIEIDREGWRVAPPAAPGGPLFQRPRDALPLPLPVAGGSLEELRPFVNVTDEDWPLALGWLLGAVMPRGPYPVLVLSGEQGSAKTWTTRALRAVVDPSVAEDRGAPKDLDAASTAAEACRIVAFDNLSWASDELADLLCRLATGAGIGRRKLYTDHDEHTLRISRPVLLNGIPELATRGDLASRAIALRAPLLEEYQDERRLNAAYAAAHPRVLGALLDCLSVALRNHSSVVLKGTAPRMVDFTRWVEAAAPALGWEPGSFMEAFKRNQAQGKRIVLEASPLATAIYAVALEGFDGTASALLQLLNDREHDRGRERGWPRTANRLSGDLTRLAPALRELGCAVTDRQVSGSRRWSLHVEGQAPVPALTKPNL